MEENVTNVVSSTSESSTQGIDTHTSESVTETPSLGNDVVVPNDTQSNIDTPQPNPEDIAKEMVEEVKDEVKNEEIEEKIFTPDDIDFESMTPYDDVEGYNFSDLAKEYGIDMGDDEALGEIKDYAKKIKEAGFNQQQAELFFKTHLDIIINNKKAEEESYKPENIVKNLKENLSIEEQRNYKPILNWINQSNKDGALPQQLVNDAMANPTIVKFLNVLYKNSTSKTPVEVPKPVVKGGISAKTAVEKYKEWMNSQPNVSQENVKQYVLGLKQMVDQNSMDDFNSIFKSMLK